MGLPRLPGRTAVPTKRTTSHHPHPTTHKQMMLGVQLVVYHSLVAARGYKDLLSRIQSYHVSKSRDRLCRGEREVPPSSVQSAPASRKVITSVRPRRPFCEGTSLADSFKISSQPVMDPEVQEEALTLENIRLRSLRPSRDDETQSETSAFEDALSSHGEATSSGLLRLNMLGGKHAASKRTAALVGAIGGLPALERFASRFYSRCLADPQVEAFITSHDDPHGQRFASWIAERLGHGTPWSEGGGSQVSIAKRSPVDDGGRRFKLDECRVWMRLHFWACREEGLFDHAAFADYYVRFIGYVIEVGAHLP